MARNKRKSYDDEIRADAGACPVCGCRHFDMVRTEKVGASVRRVRQCRYCGRETVAE